MAQIGIYPGTFDPIHEGHIAFALGAIKTCYLDSVALAPEKHPRGKPLASDVSLRNSAVHSAVQNIDELTVIYLATSPYRPQETIQELTSVYPHDSLSLLIGSDVCLTLDLWEGLPLLVGSFELIIGVRDGHAEADLQKYLAWLSQARQLPIRATFIATDKSALSSTRLRKK